MNSYQIAKNCVFCRYSTAEKRKCDFFQSLNYVDINLKSRFLIKSCCYINPSPSTVLLLTHHYIKKLYNWIYANGNALAQVSVRLADDLKTFVWCHLFTDTILETGIYSIQSKSQIEPFRWRGFIWYPMVCYTFFLVRIKRKCGSITWFYVLCLTESSNCGRTKGTNSKTC